MTGQAATDGYVVSQLIQPSVHLAAAKQVRIDMPPNLGPLLKQNSLFIKIPLLRVHFSDDDPVNSFPRIYTTLHDLEQQFI